MSTRANLKVEIASVPDREDVVAEVWVRDVQLAEIRHEPDGERVQFYSAPSGTPWDLPLRELLSALDDARARLGLGRE